MARTKPAAAAAPSDDTLIGVAPPADAPVGEVIQVPSDGTPAEGIATGNASGEMLLEVPEASYAPDARPLEEATDLAETVEAAAAALSDEEQAKADEFGAIIQPEFGSSASPEAPPPAAEPDEARAHECPNGHLKGSAKVWEHGLLTLNGTVHEPGTVLLLCPCDLSDDEAKRLVDLGVLTDPHQS